MPSQRKPTTAQAVRKHKGSSKEKIRKKSSGHQKMGTIKSKHKAQKPFPFFKLAAELRNEIYHLALTTDELNFEGHTDKKTKVQSVQLGLWRYKSFKLLSVNLVATCKTAYHEAAPLLYSKNRFIFDTSQTLLMFLMRIRDHHPHIMPWIEYLGIRTVSQSAATQSYRHAVFMALVGFSNLKCVQFNIKHIESHGLRKFFRDSHTWITYLSECKGSVRAGIEVISVYPPWTWTFVWGAPTEKQKQLEADKKEVDDTVLHAKLEKSFVKALK
ncbi:uncharacterized protein K452DRAFT_299629 [Aplosporella prunicola CBS 121167]|uniref:DUF7730 domain-containing protein n=1 Tax=Aplosporella prunicola CBS 121167 TaxID=1176127 RepID=A0A6A6BAH9_9PEZI|nr:uncharacterized protein K452DRAFT_299629 [Aplosporella prunicola CBS 121167]KAF2140254.1 hypothetical protein K452DRAFT_299629 [Aplosporella prunicola CBS 121167]